MPSMVRVAASCNYSQDNQHYHHHDWRVGASQLAVDLPKQGDPAAARATLNLGVLVVMAAISGTGSGESRPVVTWPEDAGNPRQTVLVGEPPHIVNGAMRWANGLDRGPCINLRVAERGRSP